MKESYTSKKRVRKNFGRIDAVADIPNLIEVLICMAIIVSLVWKKCLSLFSLFAILPETGF